MRLVRLALLAAFACAALTIDAGESVRTGSISVGSAHAKKHHHRRHKRGRKRHHRSSPPATEM
jgi:hypothetical protein